MDIVKPCIECGIVKPLNDFHKRSSMLDGHYNSCKVCRKTTSKNYYIKYKDDINIKAKDYNLKNKEKAIVRNKQYYINNSETILANNKQYVILNRRIIKKQRKQYYVKNVKKIAEYKHNYYQSPRGKAFRNNSNRRRKALKKSQLHPLNNSLIEHQLEMIRQRVEECLGIRHDLDHVWPLSQGGLHHISNLRIVPSYINQQKHYDMSFEHPSITMWYELPNWLIQETVKWSKHND